MRVEIPAEKGNSEWKKVLAEFVRSAKMPGFRPGKAPSHLFESKYGEEIREQVISNLLRSSIDEAIKAKELDLLEIENVTDVDMGKDRVLRYVAHLLVTPEIALPDYENVELPMTDKPEITEEHLEMTMDELRQPYATYSPVEGRGLEMGDFAIVTYSTQLDGTALKDAVPSAPPVLSGKSNFWVLMAETSLFPGFCEQLIGVEIGAKKAFSLPVPEDFPIKEIAGKSLDFDVEVVGINTKILPEWNDELAGRIAEGKTLEDFRGLVRENLETKLNQRVSQMKFATISKHLLDNTSFPIPTEMVKQQADEILRDIVQGNLERGISEDDITKNETQIHETANSNANQSVRLHFIMSAVAKKEGLKVEETDLMQEIYMEAMQREIHPQKLADEIRKNGALKSFRERILMRKTADLLVKKVKVVPAENKETVA